MSQQQLVEVEHRQQPFMLQRMMKAGDLRHGQTVEVNIDNMTMVLPDQKDLVYSEAFSEERIPISPEKIALTPEFRFCEIHELEVISKDDQGDQQELPDRVKVDTRLIQAIKQMKLPNKTSFSLEGVRIFSNGFIELTPTDRTFIVVGEKRVAVG